MNVDKNASLNVDENVSMTLEKNGSMTEDKNGSVLEQPPLLQEEMVSTDHAAQFSALEIDLDLYTAFFRMLSQN